MAARDDFYRSQKTLDIVFSLSCLAMVAALAWMFVVDYDREFKTWQRKGREVEVAVLQEDVAKQQRENAAAVAAAKSKVKVKFAALDPDTANKISDENFVDDAKRLLNVVANDQIRAWTKERDALKPGYQKSSDMLSADKAKRDSLVSFRDILFHQGAPEDAVEAMEAQIEYVSGYLDKDGEKVAKMKEQLDTLDRNISDARKDASDAVADLDRLVREQDRLARLAQQRTYGWGAAFRNLPILDAFAPPFKIRQDIPEGLTIDYTFKQVQRLDRCASCHMFIDKADFTKDRLAALKGLLTRLKGMGGDMSAEEQALWESFPDRLKKGDLTDAEIAAFCAHPRQDLFVGSNSPHPVEKFGCTSCHQGQGGSATFNFAYHFPDAGKTGGKEESYEDKYKRWTNDYKWLADLHPNFLWNEPQIPARFIEASCVKCHHQVLDLVRTDGKEEAPKLIKGYRLVRELGCFGCHEISGWKGGRSVGPDMRLEPYPAADERTPEERSKLFADPTDPPGSMRKNGPSLRRVAEKSGNGWIERWIRSPRSFRPETRMPHYYGLQNNHPTQTSDYQRGDSQLAKDHAGFPDAEIKAMAFYLQKVSESWLRDLKAVQALPHSDWARQEELRLSLRKIEQERQDNPSLAPRENDPALPADLPAPELLATVQAKPELRSRLTKDQLKAAADWYGERDRLRRAAAALDSQPWPVPELAGHKGDAKRGEQLFQTKGCLACHSHEKVRETFKADEAMTDLLGEAHFGPPLVGLREKLGADQDAVRAEKWLYAWLTNPTDYHPRTFMPIPQLEAKERADLVAWLLGEGDVKPGAAWAKIQVGPGAVDELAKYYLEKALATRSEASEALKSGIRETKYLRPDADERLLAANPPASSLTAGMSHEDRKLFYLGRKTIARNGCYACHDIPGFETAKPVGVPLNDWGKKDPERLAFENIDEYLKTFWSHDAHQYDLCKEWQIYDPFFHDALAAKRRDGYLHQKLFEPRSYDWGRFKERSWDDHIKMPQFQFARFARKPGESDADYGRRAEKEERENREAVMTFILGLVAEPTPMKFVNQPREDRAREIAGLKVIEKFNCNGCHIFKPGQWEVGLAEAVGDKTMKDELLKNLANPLTQSDLKNDPGFPQSSAWRNRRTPPPDKVVIQGLPRAVNADEGLLSLEVWNAVPFRNDKGEVVQLPAGQSALNVPLKSASPHHPPYGGLYTDIHSRILAKLEKKNILADRPEMMGSAPPPLMREGQKVQPRWLLEFLQKPFGMRPSVFRHLKMPRFNMTEEEAQTLVNYFIAVDRQQEKALGLEYFAPRPPQQSPVFHEQKRADYRAKLKQFTDLSPEEIAKADYFETGWQTLVNRQLCLQCHNAGTFVAEGELIAKGPAFYHAAERLRPEYIERWVSVPKRTIPYTKMNWFEQFYQRDDYAANRQALKEKPGVKASAQLAPLLSAVLARPVGGFLFPLPDVMLKQLQVEFALRPEEKVQAARDAIQSWGYLKNPPPTGQKAGPRQDSLLGDHP